MWRFMPTSPLRSALASVPRPRSPAWRRLCAPPKPIQRCSVVERGQELPTDEESATIGRHAAEIRLVPSGPRVHRDRPSAAAMHFAARRGSRYVESSIILICKWGELAHAAKHPRDRPRTRQALSECLGKTSPAEPPRFMLSVERPPDCARSPSLQIIDRTSRPRVPFTADPSPRPSASFASSFAALQAQLARRRLFLLPSCGAAATAVGEETRSRTRAGAARVNRMGG